MKRRIIKSNYQNRLEKNDVQIVSTLLREAKIDLTLPCVMSLERGEDTASPE